ncbi:MAG TPA: SH3 domain-containing protein [Bradyrhizobium sp.]|uniref:SH3 domain-containing protein n=1 Tax=Bradyrhizobium sp. TaxID=376 RepID=UPI002C87D378|nr:SH3 domain-containing protein [Bradyrhizobium sp.]HLZ03718.1 SH3 domain-containing protein [Bradyrhizobium sp.]
MLRPRFLLFNLGWFVALALMVGAASADTAAVQRYVTLRAAEVNLRAGPGEQFPIQWVYHRKGLPVEVIGKSDVWRKIRDWQGTEGWVHERMITGSRGAIVRGAVRPLHRDPDPASDVVARAEPGVIAKLLECRGAWCRVEISDIKGWLGRNEIWGVDPDEDVR